MINFLTLENQKTIAEVSLASLEKKISSVQDVMDFFGDCYSHDCIGIIIHKNALHDDFFDLKTGLAGEILQKFATYSMKLAIVGDFSNIQSNSLKDFIRESNQRKFINFVESVPDAIEVLKIGIHS